MRRKTNEARQFFADSGLTYQDINVVAIARLEYELADALLKQLGTTVGVSVDDKKVIVWQGDGILEAYLTVSGTWFQTREGISFNKDGFIGFAGWADDNNLEPFVIAFKKWVKWLAKNAVH